MGPAATRRGTNSRKANDRGYRIDSNVMAIKFNVLAELKELHTGDPVVCTNQKCTAILNSRSIIKEVQGKDIKVSTLLYFKG
jgi:hypothetical protein